MNAKTKRVVIKFGGHAMDDSRLNQAFCENLVFLRNKGMDFAIVHGGGPQIGKLLKKLGIESHFKDGLRVTDEDVLKVVELVLCGEVNKALVRDFLNFGLPAVGISGMDGEILKAKIKNPDLGYVGEIVSVNPALPECLLKNDFLPVIAPLALGKNNHPLNVNADTSAGAIAGALQAGYFILISDVPGVLDEAGELIPRLEWNEIEKLLESGVISGGMIPKVEACRTALSSGCKKAIILDGRAEASLKRFLLDGEPLGTVIELQ